MINQWILKNFLLTLYIWEVREANNTYVGQCSYRKPMITHVSSHILSSKVMSSTSKAPNVMTLHKVCPMLFLQTSKGSNNLLKSRTQLGPLPLKENYGNLGVPKPTPSLQQASKLPCTTKCPMPSFMIQNSLPHKYGILQESDHFHVAIMWNIIRSLYY